MSDEYGGWGNTFLFMSCIYFFTDSGTCGWALSWSKIILWWILAYSGRLFSMLGSVSSIFVYNEELWSFHPVSATSGIPHFLNPTKCTGSHFEHEYCILLLMNLVHQAVPILSVVWDFFNKPIFYRQSQFDAETTSFRIVQAAIHKSFFVSLVVFRLIHVVTNFLIFKPV